MLVRTALASVIAFGGAAALPGGAGWETARLLLGLAGGLGAACCILTAVVLLAGTVMRAQYGEMGARP
jgi:hypothetical protein